MEKLRLQLGQELVSKGWPRINAAQAAYACFPVDSDHIPSSSELSQSLRSEAFKLEDVIRHSTKFTPELQAVVQSALKFFNDEATRLEDFYYGRRARLVSSLSKSGNQSCQGCGVVSGNTDSKFCAECGSKLVQKSHQGWEYVMGEIAHQAPPQSLLAKSPLPMASQTGNPITQQYVPPRALRTVPRDWVALWSTIIGTSALGAVGLGVFIESVLIAGFYFNSDGTSQTRWESDLRTMAKNAMGAEEFASLAAIILLLVALPLFASWSFSLRKEVIPIDPSAPWSPAAAWYGWIIPVLGLFVPFKVVSQSEKMIRACNGNNAASWRSYRTSPHIIWWWCLWVAGVLLARASAYWVGKASEAYFRSTVEEALTTASVFGIVAGICLMVSAILWGMTIVRLTRLRGRTLS